MKVIKINQNEWMVTTDVESVLWILHHTPDTYYVHDHIQSELLGMVTPSDPYYFQPDTCDLNSRQMQAVSIFMQTLEEDCE